MVHRALVKANVASHTLQRVTAFDGDVVTIADVFSGTEKRLACRSLVIVGIRKPRDDLYHALMAREAGGELLYVYRHALRGFSIARTSEAAASTDPCADTTRTTSPGPIPNSRASARLISTYEDSTICRARLE